MTKEKETQGIVALEIKSFLNFVDELDIDCDSDKHIYSTKSLLKLYLYMLIKQISGFKTMAKQLTLKSELLTLFGLPGCPHRTTLSDRFKALPLLLREQIRDLHNQFVKDDVTLADALSADSSLMHAKGNVWHKKQRDKGELPKCGNVDTDAHWGVSGCGDWVYGYRVHCLVSSPSEAALPFDVEVEPANIKDYQVFKEKLALNIPQETQVLFADSGFDDEACYQICDKKNISLITPIKAKKNTPQHRLDRLALYNDPEVREVFSLRKTTVEPFQGQLKYLFSLEQLCVKGIKNVRPLVLIAALAYLLLAKLNLALGLDILKLQDTLLAIR